MFMFKDEKKRLYDELDLLRTRVKSLESDLHALSMKFFWFKKLSDIPHHEPYGIKKDGTPKAKPGRKPKK
jgi:hypothetical protein